MRTPVASKNAFATAPGIGQQGGSPTPVGSLSGRLTIAFVIFGAYLKRRIGYVTQSRLVTRVLLVWKTSESARLRPKIAPPSIWLATPSGLTIRPASIPL